jgi:hypothetical protein
VGRRILLALPTRAAPGGADAEMSLSLLLEVGCSMENSLTMMTAISALLRPRRITRPIWIMAIVSRAGEVCEAIRPREVLPYEQSGRAEPDIAVARKDQAAAKRGRAGLHGLVATLTWR